MYSSQKKVLVVVAWEDSWPLAIGCAIFGLIPDNRQKTFTYSSQVNTKDIIINSFLQFLVACYQNKLQPQPFAAKIRPDTIHHEFSAP